MERRTVLKALGSGGLVGLAGCTSQVRGSAVGHASADNSTNPHGSSGGQSMGGDGGQSPGNDLRRQISIVSQDTIPIPEKYNLEITAKVVTDSSTKSHPATVKITTTNTGAKRRINISKGFCSILNRSLGLSKPTGLWLEPARATPKNKKPNKWELNISPNQTTSFNTVACPLKVYAAGESVSTTYAVWSDYHVESYLKPGTYRFERKDIGIEKESSQSTTNHPTSTVSWGFSLKVTNPTH